MKKAAASIFPRHDQRSRLVAFAVGASMVIAFGAASIYLSRADDQVKPAAAAASSSSTRKEIKSMSDAELRQKLTPLQYQVTRENGTEPPFRNEFWNNHREGIYVDLISGEPLFSSTDKFESGTGWPSFTKPIEKSNIVEKTDRSLFMARTEVRSRKDDAHLGHVFDDGPAPTGLRYCLNSASLRFVPKEKMAAEGYGNYLYLFEQPAKK